MAGFKDIDKNYRNKLIIKFFTILCGTVGAFILLFSVVVFAFFIPTVGGFGGEGFGGVVMSNINNPESIFQQPSVPVRTSFLILGLDNERDGVDAAMIGVFNRTTGGVDLISIPRDLTVQPTPSVATFMQENGIVFNVSPILTNMSVSAGEHYATVLRMQLEDMLGVNIDFTLSVGLDAFSSIVDLIGGVYMYVPERMFYRGIDPDGVFTIDIQQGYQLLDGHDAMGVVRFREYANLTADLERMRTQQAFLTALASQVLSNPNLIAIADDLAREILRHVNTDFTLADMILYLPFITSIDPENISTQTLPHGDWRRYVGIPMDPVEAQKVINRVFFGMIVEEESETNEEGEEV